VLAGDPLEVAGVVLRGEGVLLAADRGDLLGEAARRVLGGALEQQVLEEMREAGLAGRLVGGSDLVPDHVGDDRRAAIRDHHHFETVRQREVADLGLRFGLGLGLLGEGRARDQNESCGETGYGHAATAGMLGGWQFNLARV